MLWCGAATSQTLPSGVVNDQVQLGDVFATQVLDVVDPIEVVGATTALGNGATVFTDGREVDVQSRQKLQGDVRASMTLNADQHLGWDVALDTTATGNAGVANTINGGAVRGDFKQKAGAVTVRAGTGVFAADAAAGDISVSSTAVANSQAFGAESGGSVDTRLRQSSAAIVEAATGVTMRYVQGGASFASSAVNNNLTAAGVDGAQMDLDVRQSASGDHTQGTVFVSAGTIGSASAAASAVANNISVENHGAPLSVNAVQRNTSYVRAQTVNNVDSFGQSTTLAYGVGNSNMVTEFGPGLTLDNSQFNDGGVAAIAEAHGREGFDMAAQSTAIGNAVTGTVCTDCGGVMSVNNRQVNRSNVVATTTMGLTGSNRNVSGVATAVGNTASFIATSPGN